MDIFVQKDFDLLKRDANGYLHCPKGDWSNVDFHGAHNILFPDYCQFGNRTHFGNGCSFGRWSKFGELCTFGDDCGFGEWSAFGKECLFGHRGKFRVSCIFGERCIFGRRCEFFYGCQFHGVCKFQDECRFSAGCEFLGWPRLGKKCSMENSKVQNASCIFVDNVGPANHKIMIYCDTETGRVHMKDQSWFGECPEFKRRARATWRGTKYEQDYLILADFALSYFARFAVQKGAAHAV